MLLQLLVSFLTSFVFGAKVYNCPDGWTNNTNCGYTACYYLIEADGTMNTIINDLCPKMNNLSYGASIHCADEKAFTSSTFGKACTGMYLYGVTWSPTAFVNQDGTPIDYTNWAASEPNDNTSNLAVLQTAGGSWYDVGGTTCTHILCKIKLNTKTCKNKA
uniref:C-type lectin domain-containing protein n=1 Tax=Panagrellus redivivus TaxID=6233 RepID=A0A7E4W7Q2_PANRE